MDSIKKDEKIINILMVENDKSLVTDLKDWIKKSEIESKNHLSFNFAKEVKEALKQMNERKFNLIVMEIALPVISGYYLINAIRKDDKDVQIMIYTRLKNPQDLAKMASASVNNIFLKELMSTQDLVEIVNKKETTGNIDEIVLELNSQIKALHKSNNGADIKLIQCPQCHLIIAPKSHFCNNCGQKIFKKKAANLKTNPEKNK